MSLRKALMASTLALTCAAPALAQPVDGFYVGAGAGLNWLSSGGSTSFELGYGGVVSLGYGFGNGIRAEVEGSFRQNDVERFAGSAGRGSSRNYGVMGNALFDFDPLFLNISPYIGAGAGYMWTEHGSAGSVGGISDGSDARFAYQAIIGASLPVAAVAGLALTAEYRYMSTLEAEIPNNFSPNGRLNHTPRNHSLFFGIRYAFGASPAVPVAVAPEPARTYLVFFDWNRDNLSDRARQIIADAAANSRRVQTTRIEVAGHADRTGTAQYNQRLSERRAENVAAELVRLGVPRNEIATVGFGFDRPLVPTAAGVREPQNRRVEIVLR
jgi:outer membrane protein OmpA-like peptidoglycan-associated protein